MQTELTPFRMQSAELVHRSLGWAAASGYDFIGPRLKVEGMYHSNTGTPWSRFQPGMPTFAAE